jgi:diguanylate cyclase (GGDEF)-like protein
MEADLEYTVAVVDDTANVRLLLREYLGELRVGQILEYDSAETFLDQLDAVVGSLDLVLMDVRLPGESGLEATKRLKERPQVEHLPVVAVTGDSEPERLREAFDAGCMDYLTKPIKKVELHARVQSALELKRTLDRLESRNRELEEMKQKLESANERLERQAREDGLTGIANKRHFNEKLRDEWQRAARDRSRLSLVLCDIDHFKAFNDTYGHEEGDQILSKVAAVLDEKVKRPADLAARYGGEEFVALLPETDIDGAEQVAREFNEAVYELNIEHEGARELDRLTVSCGVGTVVPQHSCPPEELVKRADRALYDAKDAGRNRVCRTEPGESL